MRVSIIPSPFPDPVLPFFIMVIFSVLILVLLTVFLLLMFQAGIREHAPRCAILSALFVLIILVLIAAIVHYRDHSIVQFSSPALVCLFVAALLLSLLKWGNQLPVINMDQATRYDERDHMFARANLTYHPDLAERYHRTHPERQAVDKAIQAMPELLSSGGRYYDPSVSPVADVAFSMLDRSYETLSDIDVQESNSLHEKDILRGLTLLAERYGAEIGIARTRPWHWYSHNGRQAHNWGKPVETRHAIAIVIVIPMDLNMIRHAPSLPVILESSRGYVLAATIAHQVADYLATHGHDAMAHVDGNYQVICAPLAQEAGMGHVGRMGIFMHHVYGPCCRISVVTTHAQLPVTNSPTGPLTRRAATPSGARSGPTVPSAFAPVRSQNRTR